MHVEQLLLYYAFSTVRGLLIENDLEANFTENYTKFNGKFMKFSRETCVHLKTCVTLPKVL